MTTAIKKLKDDLWIVFIAFTIVILIIGLHINNNSKNIEELQNRTDTMNNTLNDLREKTDNFDWECVEQASVNNTKRRYTGTAGEFCYEMMGCEYRIVDYFGEDVDLIDTPCFKKCAEKYDYLWEKDTAVFTRNETICLEERLVLKNKTRITEKVIDSTDWEFVRE